MPVPLQVGFVPIARPTFDTVLAAEMTHRARQQLQGAGLELSGPDEMVMDLASAQAVVADLERQSPDLLLVFQATFADATMTMTLAEATEAPLLLWAVPESPSGGRLRLNSLCGINLSAFSLKRLGKHFRYVYANPENPDVDLSGILRLELTLDQAADKALEMMAHTVNGRLTAAEALRHNEFVLTKLYRSA